MDKILIESIEFYGYHGATEEEQRIGHRYMVDVVLYFDTRRAGHTDNLADTINYSQVAKRIVAIGTGESFHLLEALAARMAEVLLSEFPAEGIRLRVRKIYPPMNAIAAAVGVEIERQRT